MSKSILSSEVKTIVLACEAGMGSSLMSVNALKKKFKKAGLTEVKIVHKPVRDIPADTKIVMVHTGLAKSARAKVPDAVIVTFEHFIKDPAFDKIVDAYANGAEVTDTAGEG